jgi:hypothetical protein
VGSGYATHLGQIQESGLAKVDLASNVGGCSNDSGSFTFTAANGDQITLETAGQNCSSGTTAISHDSYTVTGGTGRFSGASGSGTGTAIINLASGTSVATYSGVLSTPGSLQ